VSDRPTIPPSLPAEPVYLTEAEAAARARLSPRTLRRARLAGELRSSGGGGAHVRYRPEWLDEWLERRRLRDTGVSDTDGVAEVCTTADDATTADSVEARPSRWIYFIQAGNGGSIKIGWTRNVSARFRHLRKEAGGTRLSLLAVLPGFTTDERALHARFAASRLAGEWFAPSPDLLEFVRAVADDEDGIE
jgi:hypothetical protein